MRLQGFYHRRKQEHLEFKNRPKSEATLGDPGQSARSSSTLLSEPVAHDHGPRSTDHRDKLCLKSCRRTLVLDYASEVFKHTDVR